MADERDDAPAAEGSAEAADRLWEDVYPELRRRARRLFQGEREDHTLSATAVVHEAWVRLQTKDADAWTDRSHFYAVASSVMRHVLVDHARARSARKRGDGAGRESLDESIFPSAPDDADGHRVASQALDRLAETHERAALVVALRVFGGLTVPEIAKELGVSPRTVKADWATARVRLGEILEPPSPA